MCCVCDPSVHFNAPCIMFCMCLCMSEVLIRILTAGLRVTFMRVLLFVWRSVKRGCGNPRLTEILVWGTGGDVVAMSAEHEYTGC